MKNCPFCGKNINKFPCVMTIRKIMPDEVVIACPRCGARGGTAWNIKEATDKWNRRAESEDK